MVKHNLKMKENKNNRKDTKTLSFKDYILCVFATLR